MRIRKKRLHPNIFREDEGVIFVHSVVNQMRCVWRPTAKHDTGFDGEIELGQDGDATGFIIKVQVKSGSSYLVNKKGTGFDVLIEPADLGYWQATNVPVILAVFDPERQEGYWKEVKPYLQKNLPSSSAPYRIHFSRLADRFVRQSFIGLTSVVIKDEAVLTNFLTLVQIRL